jgi:SAM-dependent methyltransferase
MFGFLSKSRFLRSRFDFWRSNAKSFKDAQDLCVGSWNEQEAYPYTDYLLERYNGPMGKAYDFGCGVGRMMKHMLGRFAHVDGGELVPANIAFAKDYLKDQKNFSIFQLDGKSAFVGAKSDYDFIYSTICIHHIAPFEIRNQIYKDFFAMLKPGGAFCTQLVFGIDTGTHWFDSPYEKIMPQNTVDVSIPDESHFAAIEAWLKKIGFTDIIAT